MRHLEFYAITELCAGYASIQFDRDGCTLSVSLPHPDHSKQSCPQHPIRY